MLKELMYALVCVEFSPLVSIVIISERNMPMETTTLSTISERLNYKVICSVATIVGCSVFFNSILFVQNILSWHSGPA